MLELSDPINVWAFFKKGAITPYVFFWNSRRIEIEKVNLVHQSREGNKTLYHFSVSSGGNFYRLGFDGTELKWILEAVEES
jgi:hypothetical protein